MAGGKGDRRCPRTAASRSDELAAWRLAVRSANDGALTTTSALLNDHLALPCMLLAHDVRLAWLTRLPRLTTASLSGPARCDKPRLCLLASVPSPLRRTDTDLMQALIGVKRLVGVVVSRGLWVAEVIGSIPVSDLLLVLFCAQLDLA